MAIIALFLLWREPLPDDEARPSPKGDRVYVHVMDWPDRALVIPRLARPVKSARVLGGEPVPVSSVDNGFLLRIPETGRNEFDTVV